MAASVRRIGLGENDEAMDAGGGISVDGVAVEGADGSDGDLEFSQVDGAGMLIAGSFQGGDAGAGLVHGEAEAVPSVAHGDGAAQGSGTFAADDDGRRGALDGPGVSGDAAE